MRRGTGASMAVNPGAAAGSVYPHDSGGSGIALCKRIIGMRMMKRWLKEEAFEAVTEGVGVGCR